MFHKFNDKLVIVMADKNKAKPWISTENQTLLI